MIFFDKKKRRILEKESKERGDEQMELLSNFPSRVIPLEGN
jgi:hypothetical protein